MTTVFEQGGYYVGPSRAPDNRALARALAADPQMARRRRNAATNIHDDATAQKLGFRGGTIAGSVHLDQFPPVLLEAFGPTWFETGSLSLAFRNATISGDEVIAKVQVPPRDGNPDDGVRVEARMERPDGTIVAEGTASVGADAPQSHLFTIDLRGGADDLRLLAGVEAGAPMPTREVTLSHKVMDARIEAKSMTEPLDWYADASPWGPPIAPPSLVVRLMQELGGAAFGSHVRDAVGLFGAIEVRHHAGPVLFDVPYTLAGEIIAVGASPKTEYVWFDRRASDAGGRVVASMRMQLRWMKASSPAYA